MSSAKLSLYESEFANLLLSAKNKILKIKNRKDRKIALKYVAMLASLSSTDLVMQRNRNEFFAYFLGVLDKQLETENVLKAEPTELSLGQTQFTSEQYKSLHDAALAAKSEKVMMNWSEDRKTYVAAKLLPGKGALLYMAVSSSSIDGWDKRSSLRR